MLKQTQGDTGYLGLAIISGVLLLLAGCEAPPPTNPLYNSSTRNSLANDERELWKTADDIEEKIGKSAGNFEDKELTALYLRDVMQKISSDFNNSQMQIRVYVFSDTNPNAFVLPNGAVFVTTGMLALLENEAQLASVLGHEFQHFRYRHHIGKERTAHNSAVAGMIVGLAAAIAASGGNGGNVNTNIAGSFSNLWSLCATSSFSQEQERQADQASMIYVIKAGYEPNQSARAFELLQEFDRKAGHREQTMFSSHPALAERIESCRHIAQSNISQSGHELNAEAYYKMSYPAIIENARLNMKLRNNDIATDNINKCLAHDPKCARAYFLLGQMEWEKSPQQEQNMKSMYNFIKAAELDPNYAPCYREIGLLYRYGGQKQKSREMLTKYLELAPGAVDAAVIRSYLDKPD
jgi:beta-barrel assembly-enhancing protease